MKPNSEKTEASYVLFRLRLSALANFLLP